MDQSQAVPGKKIKLEVHRDDAPKLQARGKEFFQAIKGKTVHPDSLVAFDGVLMGVKATKPKGAIKVVDRTAIKMELSKSPITLGCGQCGQQHNAPADSCTSCGQELPLVSL